MIMPCRSCVLFLVVSGFWVLLLKRSVVRLIYACTHASMRCVYISPPLQIICACVCVQRSMQAFILIWIILTICSLFLAGYFICVMICVYLLFVIPRRHYLNSTASLCPILICVTLKNNDSYIKKIYNNYNSSFRHLMGKWVSNCTWPFPFSNHLLIICYPSLSF